MADFQSYKCKVIELRDDSFLAYAIDSEEEIVFSFDDLDLDDRYKIKPGVIFYLLVNRYRIKIFSFDPID